MCIKAYLSVWDGFTMIPGVTPVKSTTHMLIGLATTVISLVLNNTNKK